MLHTVMPHMHLLGKSIKVTMTPPDGKPVDAGRHHGLGLQLAGDVLVQGADPGEGRDEARRSRRSTTTATRTPTTRSNPPKMVGFGEQTTDEMLFGFLGMTSTTKPWREVRFRTLRPAKKGDKPADPFAVLQEACRHVGDGDGVPQVGAYAEGDEVRRHRDVGDDPERASTWRAKASRKRPRQRSS